MNDTEKTKRKITPTDAAEKSGTRKTAGKSAVQGAKAARGVRTAAKTAGTGLPTENAAPVEAMAAIETEATAAAGKPAGTGRKKPASKPAARSAAGEGKAAAATQKGKTTPRTAKAPARRGTAAKAESAPKPDAAHEPEQAGQTALPETLGDAATENKAEEQTSVFEETSMPAVDEAETAAYDFNAAEERLTYLQQKIREAKIPVVILLEGWCAAGKGTMAGELLEGLDPRGYKVCVNERFSKEEDAYPYLHRYWVNMPRKGNITLFIGGWYEKISAELVKGKDASKALLEKARLMEEMLYRDGVVVLKFFIDISKKEQKRRLTELERKKRTCKLVCKADWEQNEAYSRWKKAYERARKATDLPGQEWHLLSGEDKRECKQALYQTVISAFEDAIARADKGDRTWDTAQLREHTPIEPAIIQHLQMFEPSQAMEEDYKSALNAAQKKLKRLQYELYRAGIPMVIAFEGWDAAGKGGAIRRLTSALDPRGFAVEPISAPTAEEKEHHHLWRFWTRLPARGEVRIFDRTWYGRVMVERIEGFCTEHQWMRAYDEINLFERELLDAGAVICKFWLQIDNEEQLKRFNARQKTPEKQWKITEEDWRNREKWPQYEAAVDEMLQSTNTDGAPWTVVEANNKQYARIKVLHTVIAAMERALKGK